MGPVDKGSAVRRVIESLLAASYAVFPLLLAVPTGGLVDLRGERRLMAIGSAVVLACSTFLFLWGSSIVALVIGPRSSVSANLLASRPSWPTTLPHPGLTLPSAT